VSDPGIIATIGDTPLVELRRLVPPGHARVLAKVESHNPTGSLEDRMALSVVDRALAGGRLAPGGRLVEYTGGSTGTPWPVEAAGRASASHVPDFRIRPGVSPSHG